MDPNMQSYLIACAVTFVCIALFVILCTHFLKNKSEKIRLIPVIVIFFLLVVLEVWKIYRLIRTDGSFAPLRYPIVFCSLVMYAYPLFCFKKNRFSELAKGFSVIPCIIIFILFVAVQYTYPWTLMQAHSYVFHGAMMAVAIYLITSKLITFRFRDFFMNGLLIAAYILLCTVISLAIGADISLFGPESSFLSVIYSNLGYGVGNVVLMCVVMLLSAGIYGAICGSICLYHKSKNMQIQLEGGTN